MTKDTESQSVARAPAVALLVVFGCAAQLSTEQLADATSRQCEIGVDSGDLAADEAAMLAIIEESGREIVTRKRGEGYTVLPRRVLFPRDYDGRSPEIKAKKAPKATEPTRDSESLTPKRVRDAVAAFLSMDKHERAAYFAYIDSWRREHGE